MTKEINVVLKKYGLTAPQMDILRKAARKWSRYDKKSSKAILHDGQVDTYNTREDSISALKSRTLIQDEPMYDEQTRALHTQRAHDIIESAWNFVQCNGAFDVIKAEDGGVAWKLVIRITDVGRAVAAEWKAVIGAEED